MKYLLRKVTRVVELRIYQNYKTNLQTLKLKITFVRENYILYILLKIKLRSRVHCLFIIYYYEKKNTIYLNLHNLVLLLFLFI